MSHQALTNEISVPVIDIHRLARAQEPGLATEFHRWPLPNYIWPALERCYRSIYCSESQLRISGSLTPRIEAWVARRNGCISAVILFDRYQHHVQVLNEVFSLSAQVLSEFANAVFDLYPKLRVIRIRALKIAALPKHYIGFSTEMSDDYRLELPVSVEQWYRSLSARTREKLRYYLRRAQQRAPSFRFRTLGTDEISLAQVKQIIQFNRARMQVKGKRFGMSAAEEHQTCQIMLERGQLSIIEIDGQPCAGLLCTWVNGEVFMHVIAHDPAYDDLRLGLLCCALTIEDAIAKGCQQFHFLWGQYDYKTRLGGEREALSQVLLFRDTSAFLQQPGLLASHTWAWSLASARRWVRHLRRR
jgi:CelD/BcsL family acetyltransferase involved in cellulose biosynthesis